MDALTIAEGVLRKPTVPYHEHLVAEHCAMTARDLGLVVTLDEAGNVLVRYDAPDADSDAPLVLVAHLDHPGFVVDDETGDRVSMTFHGGLGAEHAVEGSPVHFFDDEHDAPIGRGALVAATETAGRLTGGVAEILDGAAPAGSMAMWGFPPWEIADGRIIGRVCDDLLGVAAALACLSEVRRRAPEGVAVLEPSHPCRGSRVPRRPRSDPARHRSAGQHRAVTRVLEGTATRQAG